MNLLPEEGAKENSEERKTIWPAWSNCCRLRGVPYIIYFSSVACVRDVSMFTDALSSMQSLN